MSGIAVGTQLPTVEQRCSLTTSVVYAGASGDMNPLHFDPEFAARVSPTGGVIAHGMYSMGLAARVLTGLAGGPGRIVDVQVRFTRPWPVGTTATFGGKVTAIDDEGIATVSLWGSTGDGDRILRGTGRFRT